MEPSIKEEVAKSKNLRKLKECVKASPTKVASALAMEMRSPNQRKKTIEPAENGTKVCFFAKK